MEEEGVGWEERLPQHHELVESKIFRISCHMVTGQSATFAQSTYLSLVPQRQLSKETFHSFLDDQ